VTNRVGCVILAPFFLVVGREIYRQGRDVGSKPKQAVICTTFAAGKEHDFHLFKRSRVKFKKQVKCLADGLSNIEIRRKQFGLRFNLIAGLYNWVCPGLPDFCKSSIICRIDKLLSYTSFLVWYRFWSFKDTGLTQEDCQNRCRFQGF